ncbi:MAG TPA: alanyl-tRNA editing protein [Acidimicrobiia bacterium]|nr:alanyl-tRNA editing protein [Acidimicrobiia bacterium]
MTEEIAATDAYARHARGAVVEVTDDGVTLDRTVFYPRGGGQPGDVGRLDWDGGSVTVTDTYKRDGAVIHVLDGDPPPPGTEVTGVIDWERRYRLMRTHTALHVLSAVIWNEWGAKVTGGNMEPGVARMDFELDSMSVEFGQEVERRLNESLSEGHPVDVRFLPRAEALADPDLIRTKVNLLPESIDPIRVIVIGTIDKQADGGTHVANTSEVGQVAVVKTESKGKGNKRMRIELVERPAS